MFRTLFAAAFTAVVASSALATEWHTAPEADLRGATSLCQLDRDTIRVSYANGNVKNWSESSVIAALAIDFRYPERCPRVVLSDYEPTVIKTTAARGLSDYERPQSARKAIDCNALLDESDIAPLGYTCK